MFQVIRRNWKKSAFMLGVVIYGGNYVSDKIKINIMMRTYAKEASKLGHKSIATEEPKKITIILNPAANKKKSRDLYEKYSAPLLNLSGIVVSLIETEKPGQTSSYMQVMGNCDMVAIAGGDGSISEAVTGLMRRPDANEITKKLPIGILPLGLTNSIAKAIFGLFDNQAYFVADATMNIVRGFYKKFDVMKIEPLDETIGVDKSIYAVSEIRWGALKEIIKLSDKYWYFGGLKPLAASLFSWSNIDLCWNCDAELRYIETCPGCKKCQGQVVSSVSPTSNKRWWQSFIPKTTTNTNTNTKQYSNITNEKCGIIKSVPLNTMDFIVNNNNLEIKDKTDTSELKIKMGPSIDTVTFMDFITRVWNEMKSDIQGEMVNLMSARELWLLPKLPEEENVTLENKEPNTEEVPENNNWLFIDQEKFETRPLHVTLLPKRVSFFCPAV